MNRVACAFAIACCLLSSTALFAQEDKKAAEPEKPAVFAVGFGKRDITPPAGLPMWGYGARHAALSKGALDPLMAKVVVIEAGDSKVALVGLDLGRGPTRSMMQEIRSEIAAKAGIHHVLISGSHTHHGPVIELTDRKGFGQENFAAAVAYSQQLPKLITEAILEADAARKPARMGVATTDITMNRNRHTKREPKVTDPMLAVVRFDDENGKPIAVLVNFAAHPVMTDVMQLKYSADYPGFMQRKVEAELGTNCFFMQGASGDQSCNPPAGVKGPQQFGEALADHVLELAKNVQTTVPEKPSIDAKTDEFVFKSRIDLSSPTIQLAFSVAFFPELMRNFVEEFKDGIPTELNTVLLNGELAIVGGSGEFFCNHSNRLKQRSYFKNTLFFGYCNGHCMYFPTIEAASEGGYGADPQVSFVEIGAGEQMMNQALVNLYTFAGKYPDRKPEK